MCHPPAATAMERHKLLVNIRKKEIIFPPTFDKEKQNQVSSVMAALNIELCQRRAIHTVDQDIFAGKSCKIFA